MPAVETDPKKIKRKPKTEIIGEFSLEDIVGDGAHDIPEEENVVKESVAEEPEVAEPIIEEPTAEEPIAEEPTAEEPSTEEPIVEEPATEEPTGNEYIIEAKPAEVSLISVGFVIPDDKQLRYEKGMEIIKDIEAISFTNYFTLDSISAYAQAKRMEVDLTTWVGITAVLDEAQKEGKVKGYAPGLNFIIEDEKGKKLHMPNAEPIPIPEEQSKDDELLSSLIAVKTEEEARRLIDGEDRDNTKTIDEENDRNPANKVASVDRNASDRNSGEMER